MHVMGHVIKASRFSSRFSGGEPGYDVGFLQSFYFTDVCLQVKARKGYLLNFMFNSCRQKPGNRAISNLNGIERAPRSNLARFPVISSF